MKRITGIFNLDRTPVDPGVMDQMLNTLKLGANDAGSVWVNEGVGLGCTDSGNMTRKPAALLYSSYPDLQCVITFDGRIDNRGELIDALKPQLTNEPLAISEEKIILAAYEKWGLECPRHLIGDFAFAIWDKRENWLICARDHFGVKPFYYHVSNESFVFGSTPNALFASRKVPIFIHEERIADLLLEFGGEGLEGIDKTSSFYRNILRLPPAHQLIVQPGGIRMERYWELCPRRSPELKTDEECIEAFQGLFSESVRCRFYDAPASASMLSGGLDSSAIVGMGAKIQAGQGKDPIHVFAVRSNDQNINRDTHYISSVLTQAHVQPHPILEIELSQWMDSLLNAIEKEGEPFDCLMNLNRAVYRHAQDQGVTAVLDGVDGDVLLSGSGQLMQLWHERAYRMIIEETLRAGGLTAEYKLGRKELFGSIISVFSGFVPEWLRKMRRRYGYRGAVGNAIKGSIIDRDFAFRSRLEDRLASLDSHSPRPPSFDQMEFHKIALNHPFLTVGLERYERVASAFGIEARHPYTDVRLVEFCLSLPWQLKTRRGWTKMILRRAMESILPAEVVWRTDKDSLMWETNRLILKEKAGYFYQITHDERENLKPYINLPKLFQFWDDYLARGEEKEAESLWAGTALAMWLRQQRRVHSVRS